MENEYQIGDKWAGRKFCKNLLFRTFCLIFIIKILFAVDLLIYIKIYKIALVYKNWMNLEFIDNLYNVSQ